MCVKHVDLENRIIPMVGIFGATLVHGVNIRNFMEKKVVNRVQKDITKVGLAFTNVHRVRLENTVHRKGGQSVEIVHKGFTKILAFTNVHRVRLENTTTRQLD